MDEKLEVKPTAKRVAIKEKGLRSSSKPASKGVPMPRHKRQQASHTSVSSELGNYLTSNAEYMRYMMKSDRDRMKIQEKRENRQNEKDEADAKAARVEARVKHAREVLTDEKMPDEMKEVARKVLMDYFTSNS